MIGFTCSTWDLMHPGHVLFLKKCKQYCIDAEIPLVIGLQTDIKDRPEKNKPIQTVFERFIQLKAVVGEDVNIIPYESEKDLLNILTLNTPHVRFLGNDYVDRDFTGSHLYDGNSVMDSSVMFFERNHTWSTSELRKRITDSWPVSNTFGGLE